MPLTVAKVSRSEQWAVSLQPGARPMAVIRAARRRKGPAAAFHMANADDWRRTTVLALAAKSPALEMRPTLLAEDLDGSGFLPKL